MKIIISDIENDNWDLISSIMRDVKKHFPLESKRIAKFVKCKKLSNNQSRELAEIYREMEQDFKNVMKSFYNKDKELAYSVMNDYPVRIKKCDDYFQKHHEPIIGNIIEKLKGVTTRIRNISRVIVYHED